MTSQYNRRNFLKKTGLGLTVLTAGPVLNTMAGQNRKPNFIVIFCDDVGWGDFGCFGHPTIRTPHVDRLAEEGQKWTNFYVASSVCTPSRAALLTGRLPIRTGMAGKKWRVIMPKSTGGFPQREITIAELLKTAGYKTACIGKWHLGHAKPEYNPIHHGFDYFYGIPMNIDHYGTNGWDYQEYKKHKDKYFKKKYYNAPLVVNDKIVEQPTDPSTVTKRYVEQSVEYIKKNKDQPFFIYLSHSMAHVPLFASEAFDKKSLRGLYGDVMEEIDWGVGEIVKTLKAEGLDENTLVVFTSDNGPWLHFAQFAGSAGPLKGGKADMWEGGFRVPTVFWWPEKIKRDVKMGLGSTMDFLPTFCKLADVQQPKDRIIDGVDLGPALFEGRSNPNKIIHYYRYDRLFAIRKGSFKAHFFTWEKESPWGNEDEFVKKQTPPLLFNVDHDPGEQFNIAEKHPDVIADLQKEFDKQVASVIPVESELDK